MPYTDKLQDAVALALELHFDQTRKGTGKVPYITHLFAVASLVGEHGGGEAEVIAALLHDGPEDQGGQATLDRVRVQFGEEVADIVSTDDNFRFVTSYFDEPVNGDARRVRANSPRTRRQMRTMARKEGVGAAEAENQPGGSAGHGKPVGKRGKGGGSAQT